MPLVVVLNKIDRVEKTALLPRMAALGSRGVRRRHRAGVGLDRRNVEHLETVLLGICPRGRRSTTTTT